MALLILTLGCVEPYEFSSINTERSLVIDGSLTNELKNHAVLLSYSYPIDTVLSESVSGATIWIEDESGNQVFLRETKPGYYETETEMAAQEGVSYRLHVQIDEDEFESDWESLTPAIPIDSIYGRYVTKPSSEDESFLNGVQFFLDSHDPTGMSTRFRYEWEETYRIRVPYRSWHIYDEIDSAVYPRPEEERVDICYNSDFGKSLILSTTDGLSESRISELPIRFADEQSVLLRSRYSLLVKQYSLNDNAYNYYKRLRENNESAGTFFDKQKGTINGNLHSVGGSDETILGYFEVAGVSEVRRYFSYLDWISDGYRLNPYPNCFISEGDTVNSQEMAEYFVGPGLNMFIINELDPPGSGNYNLLPRGCSDCTILGTRTKPEWWED